MKRREKNHLGSFGKDQLMQQWRRVSKYKSKELKNLEDHQK